MLSTADGVCLNGTTTTAGVNKDKLRRQSCSNGSSSSSSSSDAASDTSSSSVVSSASLSPFRKMAEMWHPHGYRPPPANRKPTPFSIDDILRNGEKAENAANSVSDTAAVAAATLQAQMFYAAALAAASASASSALATNSNDMSEATSAAASPECGGVSGDDVDDDDDQPLNLTTAKGVESDNLMQQQHRKRGEHEKSRELQEPIN